MHGMKHMVYACGKRNMIGVMAMFLFGACAYDYQGTTPPLDGGVEGGVEGGGDTTDGPAEAANDVGAADATSEAPPCDHCSKRVTERTVTYALCNENGPPSSKTVLYALTACFCEVCPDDCDGTCSGKIYPTVQCLECSSKLCPDEYAACMAN